MAMVKIAVINSARILIGTVCTQPGRKEIKFIIDAPFGRALCFNMMASLPRRKLKMIEGK